MASLYEITRDYRELFESYEAIDSMEFESDGKGGFIDDDGNKIDPDDVRSVMRETWFDTLDAMEDDVQEKAANVAVYIKNITAEAAALKAEEARLKSRRMAKENDAKRFKEYLISCMDAAALKKIERVQAHISIRSNAEAVSIIDESSFIGWAELHDRDDLLRYHTPDINKPAVKALIKSGGKVPYAELTRSRSVIIK